MIQSVLDLFELSGKPSTPAANHRYIYHKTGGWFDEDESSNERRFVTATAPAVLGDLLYSDVTPDWVRLAGNTTATKKFLRQTGTGVVSAAPAWDTIALGDIAGTPGCLARFALGTGLLEANAALTSTHVLYADANGWPTGSANLTFSANNLYVSGHISAGLSTFRAWGAQYTALQIGGLTSIMTLTAASAGADSYWVQNSYWDTDWKYTIADEASRIAQQNGIIRFLVAPVGVADAAITWTESLKILNSGDWNYKSAVKWYPFSDSVTALQFPKADGTTIVVNVDTTNARVGFGGEVTPERAIDILDGTNPQVRLSQAATKWVDLQSDSNGDLYVIPAGGGALVQASVAGGMYYILNNTNSGGGAFARCGAQVKATTSGDPFFYCRIADTATVWAFGLDNSNADAFTITPNIDLSAGPIFTILTGGNVGIKTTHPDRALDVLDAAAAQCRFTQADGTVFRDWQVTSTALLKLTGLTTDNTDKEFEIESTRVIAGAVTDGYCGGIILDPAYSAASALTVTRHNYITLEDVALAGAGPAALTDAAVFRFDAAAGTHKAIAAGSTKVTPGTVDAWLKVNINGTLYYVPAYTSMVA
jgi:hypothetical protein